ncbi:adenylate/guanylate cyclase domain-containing protein [Marinobacterium rhizophilum]|uniref:PAS domain-containing protein n=1 Tax=Marinobacterium rhizophilum TaxID=420402 RepID=A0ABY5HQI3_9GAMM|nr:adenylate/guanylate cyclase domain-containing protein [Marinobacterium rhizophilum]UTW13430.1 PAS domain-containing protein [Marinobacterium rhizophilum]
MIRLERIFGGLRSRLLLLVALAVIPAFILIVTANIDARRTATRTVQADLQRLIRLTVGQQQQFIEGARQLLAALAHLPSVREQDGAACSALFADFLRLYPFYANLGASNLEGDIFCSALRITRRINLADRAYAIGALSSGGFAIGEYQIGRITGKAAVNFGAPVFDAQGKPQGIVYAALDLSWLEKQAREAELDPGTSLTLLDRNGKILVHYPSAQQVAGTSIADTPLFKEIQATRGRGAFETHNLAGAKSLFVVAPIQGETTAGADENYAVYLAIGVPRDLAFADINREFSRNLLIFGLVALVALALAWAFANVLILRSVDALRSATKALEAGNLQARTGLKPGKSELADLAHSFDAMAERLQDRELKLSRSLAETTELKNLLDNLFASIVSGVMTSDLDGNISMCNRAAVRILGLRDNSDLVGKNLAELLPPLGTSLLPYLFKVRKSDQPVIGIELSQLLPQRGTVHLRFNISGLRAADEIQGIAMVLDDVTEKKRMEAQHLLLQSMVSPAILEQLDPEHLQLGGQRSEITVMFADIHGFTSISEQLNAEDLVSLLNQYLAAMANAILIEEGTIDKFLGDAVMAWFNAPVPQPDHVLRAIRSALAIRQAIRSLHDSLSPIFRLSFGIGIHVGEAVLGLVGTQDRVEYTAIGDDVNTAKRIQEHAGIDQILLSAAVYAQVADQIEVHPAIEIQVKGKHLPLRVYELIGLK